MSPSESPRECRNCGGEIPPEKRSDADYCSDRCRYLWHNAGGEPNHRHLPPPEKCTDEQLRAQLKRYLAQMYPGQRGRLRVRWDGREEEQA